MNIQVIAAASVPTPPAGYRTLFIDSSNNGLLTWKLDDGTLVLFSDAQDADCCACEISKEQMAAIACSLKSGMVSPEQYQAIITMGINVSATETTDVNGNKTCTVNVGPNSPVIVPTALSIIPLTDTLAVAATLQFYPRFTPTNTSNQNVVWTSSDPTKATIDANGLVTGVAAGTTTIRVYSVADMAIFGERLVTVTP